jgi:DNA-directed RNA polymerase subunit RPC12/RpoP
VPRYFYECSSCGEQFRVVHGMMDQQDHCIVCSSINCLTRIPQITTTLSPISEEATRVKKAIEENKEIIKQMKKEARSQTYDD